VSVKSPEIKRDALNSASVGQVGSLGNRLFGHHTIIIMNGDTLAIALDRLKFYSRDAVVTLAQVSYRCSKVAGGRLIAVHL
jgi:hypothetical protein